MNTISIPNTKYAKQNIWVESNIQLNKICGLSRYKYQNELNVIGLKQESLNISKGA